MLLRNLFAKTLKMHEKLEKNNCTLASLKAKNWELRGRNKTLIRQHARQLNALKAKADVVMWGEVGTGCLLIIMRSTVSAPVAAAAASAERFRSQTHAA